MSETSQERIEDLPIIEEMQDSYLTYAMSVIMSRALPDGRDGVRYGREEAQTAVEHLKA